MRHRLFVVLLLSALVAVSLAAQTSASAASDPYKPVLDRLYSITAVPLPDWRTHPADLPHGENPDLSDAVWNAAKVNEPWSDGSRWMRHTIVIPEQLNGYDLRGTRVDLDLAFTSNDAIHVATFSNGSLIGRTDEDTQLPITLTENAQPGQKFVIAVQIVGNNVPTRLYRAQLVIHAAANRPDPGILRLEVLSARPVIDAYDSGKQARDRQLDAVVKAIDIAALDRGDQAAFDASLRQAQQDMEALRPYLKQFSIRCVGNSHIDMAWLWPWTETVEVVRNTFTSALQLMREYPDLTFTMATAQTYAWMQEKYPDLFKEIQQRVKEGRWEIVGGMWVEPDLNLPSGESLVRQILYGKRYFEKNFGVDVNIGWNPDSFGYNWQLPQIYKRSGIDYFVTQKIYWNDTTKFPYKLFWWEAPDGSRLLTYFPHDYANPIEPVRMAGDVAMYAPPMWKLDAGKNLAKPGELEMMYLFGVGDHGGGPTRLDLDTAAEWEKPGVVFPNIKFGTAGEFFRDIDKRLPELKVPTWDSELYLEYHRGVQTTQSEEKRRNRQSEVLMLNAEKLASIDSLFGAAYPHPLFDTAWKKVLFNQFHDILPGSGIAVNYVDAARKYEEVKLIGHKIERTALSDLAARVNTPSTSVLVFNPLSWARSDEVDAEVQFPGRVQHLSAIAPDGKSLPVEILSNDPQTNRAKLRILAENVPAIGYEVIKLVPSAVARPVKTDLVAKPDLLENEFLRLAVDPQTGCITSLYDKRSNTETLAPAVPGPGAPALTPSGKPCGNLLQIFVDKPQKWDAWNIDADFIDHHWDLMQADEVKLVENSPLRAVIRVKKHYEGSSFVQDITMYPGIDRVDVRMSADWHAKHLLLKVAFPLSAHNDNATFEIPYGSIERPTIRNTPREKAQFEVPALRWADLSDATHGFSLLNASKYGYDAKDNVLRLSLLRAPTWPDPNTDQGHHEFTYALYPHGGSWKQALTVQQARDLNFPLIAVPMEPHRGPLPASHSFFSTDASNVVITAVKRSEDGNNLIVRFYEWAGQKTDVHLKVPAGVVSAEETNLMEKPEHPLVMTADKSTVIVPTSPYEIKTVELHMQ